MRHTSALATLVVALVLVSLPFFMLYLLSIMEPAP